MSNRNTSDTYDDNINTSHNSFELMDDIALDDFIPLYTADAPSISNQELRRRSESQRKSSEEPVSTSVSDKEALRRRKHAERQRLYKERKKAEALLISSKIEETSTQLQSLQLENRQIATENAAMEILKEYKDNIIQLMTSSYRNINTVIGLINVQKIQDMLWEKFKHPPEALVRAVVPYLNADAFRQNAKTFHARLAVLRCQLDEAKDEETRQRLEHRLAVIISYRIRCWEILEELNPQVLHELLIRANEACAVEPFFIVDEEDTTKIDSIERASKRRSTSAATSTHVSHGSSSSGGGGGITFVFQCPVTQESRSVCLSRQQVQMILPVCEEYEASLLKARENLHKKVSELLVTHSMPVQMDGDQDEFIKMAIASHLSAVEAVEVLGEHRRQANEAKLKLLLSAFKLLTPIQFCDTILGSNWASGVGFFAWAEAVCLMFTQASKKVIHGGDRKKRDTINNSGSIQGSKDVSSLFQW